MRVLGGLGHCCIADVRLLQTAGVVLALVSYIIAMQDRAAAVVISDFEHNGVVDSGAGLHGTGESVATLSIDSSSNMPTNPKLFGLNDVLGPVMHIPYNSKTLISAVESLRIGYLRHPGGGVANYWNITSGRYATSCSHSSACNMSSAVNKFPEGTFSPANFVKYLTSKTGAELPVFDLNVLTMSEDTFDMQVNTLAPFCVDSECYVEIGNEIYLTNQYSWRFPNADAYMKTGEVLINKLRQRFPKVKVSVAAGGIQSFMSATLASSMGYHNVEHSKAAAESWRKTLAEYRHLFDAVTIHDYQSVHHGQEADNNTRTTALASWPEVAYGEVVPFCKRLFGDDIIVLITEYNMGLSKTEQLDLNGGPHALNMLSHIMSGIQHGTTIRAMQYHAMLSVIGIGWDLKAGMVQLASPNATKASVNGVSQLFAHIASLGAATTSMYKVNIAGGPKTPASMPAGLRNISCLQAVAFSSSSPKSSIAVINRCSESISFQVQSDQGVATMAVITYNCGPSEIGGWVDMPSSSAAFPWPGPLTSTKPTTSTLAPFSFSVLDMAP